MRPVVALVLAAVPVSLLSVAWLAGRSEAQSAGIGSAILKHEPVLVFDVSGSTLTGPLHISYRVYNDGYIAGSECGGPFGVNSAGTAGASEAEVLALQKALIDAGGMSLPDQNLSVADIPLTTVTVFRGDTNARAHTFSYWTNDAEYAALGQVISDFMTAHPVSCQGISSTE